MATFEEVVEFAARQLDERGLLLDRQLAPMVEGDNELLRRVCDSLLAAKVAERRFGIGLARIGKPGVCVAALQEGQIRDDSQANSSNADGDLWFDEDTPTAEWWVMSNGIVRGPWTMEKLVAMRVRNELLMSDLLRLGSRGMWIKPDEVAEINEAVPFVAPQAPAPVVPNTNSAARVEVETSTSKSRLSDVDLDSLDDHQLADRVSQRLRPRKQCSSNSRVTAAPESREADENDSEAVAADAGDVKFPRHREKEVVSIPVSEASIPTRSAAVRSGIAFNRDWRSWSLDALTTALAFMIPSAFNLLFSRRGKGLRMFAFGLPLVIGIVVGVYWIWPPSNHFMIQTFESVHDHAKQAKLTKKREEDLVADLAYDRARIQRIVRYLEGCPTDQPSIYRELLMAGKHGLLVVLEHPRQSDHFETIFVNHIKRAKAMHEGRPVEEPKPNPPTPVTVPTFEQPADDPMSIVQPQTQ